MKSLWIIITLLFAQSYAWSSHLKDVKSLYAPEFNMAEVLEERAFWVEKINQSDQITFRIQLAGTYTSEFKINADVTALNKAEMLMKDVHYKSPLNRAGICRSLANIYISQHRFCDALDVLLEASEEGSGFRATQLMLYDVYAELGADNEAQVVLKNLAVNRDFHYIIRLAKWEDSQGNLDEAVTLLEEAREMAMASKNKALICWIYSNLGDFYGHQGNIQASEESYLKALQENPSDWYSAKGLAWIAYSDRDDAPASLSILNQLRKTVHSPDLLLLESEIRIYLGEETTGKALKNAAIQQVTAPEYGDMYNIVVACHLAENDSAFMAIKLAEKEISNRPTPEAYAVLAYAHYKNGDCEEAIALSKKYVIDKTFEPKPLWYQYPIFRNDPLTSLSILNELSGARYELGPVKFKKLGKASQS
jgi:tetratricopeptide (TPR) repeat protein